MRNKARTKSACNPWRQSRRYRAARSYAAPCSRGTGRLCSRASVAAVGACASQTYLCVVPWEGRRIRRALRNSRKWCDGGDATRSRRRWNRGPSPPLPVSRTPVGDDSCALCSLRENAAPPSRLRCLASISASRGVVLLQCQGAGVLLTLMHRDTAVCTWKHRGDRYDARMQYATVIRSPITWRLANYVFESCLCLGRHYSAANVASYRSLKGWKRSCPLLQCECVIGSLIYCAAIPSCDRNVPPSASSFTISHPPASLPFACNRGYVGQLE